MNRRKMRVVVSLIVVLALLASVALTLVTSLRSARIDEPVALLPGIEITPQEFLAAGAGEAVAVERAGKTFIFFAGEDATETSAELAQAKSGVAVDFRGGASATFLGGQFDDATIRDRAFVWYRSMVSENGLVDDTGPAVIGDRSARYADVTAAAVLVQKGNTVFTLVYSVQEASVTSSTPRPIVAAEALARLISSAL
ncbi:MAG: hypothetical protein Q7V53_03165 [Caldisericota bacterium]|nr:hypothetical protein [Caldisericota bacterium]